MFESVGWLGAAGKGIASMSREVIDRLPDDPGGLLKVMDAVVTRLGAADADVHELSDVRAVIAGCDRQVNRLEAVKLDWTASFQRRRGHKATGHKDTQHFLEDELRHNPGKAKSQAETARRLADDLSDTRKALQDGDISADHAAEIAKAAGKVEPDDVADAEDRLLDAARTGNVAQVRKTGRRLEQAADRKAANDQARRSFRQRHLDVTDDGNGSMFIRGRLPQLGGEKLLTALGPLSAPEGRDDERTPGQRRADALVRLAEIGLNGGSLPQENGQPPTVVAVVPIGAVEDRAGLERGSLNWSGPVPDVVFDQLMCEANLDWLITSSDGKPLFYGTSKRYATAHQKRALKVRDGGCRWPGCTCRWVIAHHEPPVGTPGWGTDVDKMLALCGVHHNLRHFTSWSVEFDPDDDARVTVTSPDSTFTATETASEARRRHLHAADPTGPADTVETPGLFDESAEAPSGIASEPSVDYDAVACEPPPPVELVCADDATSPSRRRPRSRRRERQPRAP